MRLLVERDRADRNMWFLIQELWNEPTDPQYLRVYVRQLRQKIEADPSAPRHVLTEPGIGYRLV